MRFRIKWVRPRVKPRRVLPRRHRGAYLKYKEAARDLVLQRLAYFNAHYHLRWNRVAIRNAKTLWGSCSKKGNLNFNYRIVYLPQEQADYLIVHELCHLKEFNHSKRFWELVAQTAPNYKALRRELKGTL
jgi:predicted metal-dependent hydrolase